MKPEEWAYVRPEECDPYTMSVAPSQCWPGLASAPPLPGLVGRCWITLKPREEEVVACQGHTFHLQLVSIRKSVA
jgi:hypothetical protein